MASVFEVRDYHYRGDRMEEYRAWAAEASKLLSSRLDVLGFWVDVGIPPRIMGSDPMELPHGSANITWVIRWEDMEQREVGWEKLWEDREWNEKWDEHPGFDDYLHMSVRFLKEASELELT